MASSNADSKTRIATLRHEILSYKPGKVVPCNDKRVVFPDKLVVGFIETRPYALTPKVVPALGRALHGDVKPSKHADKRQSSTEDEEEYLTDSISVIRKIARPGLREGGLQDLAGKVGCMVMFVRPTYIELGLEWIKTIIRITRRVPLCGILPLGDTPKARNKLKHLGITDMYEVPFPDGDILSDEDQLQWLDLLSGCLNEGDRARAEKQMRLLDADMTKKLKSKQQRVDALTEVVREKERNETSLRQQFEELKKGREEDRARAEKEKCSLAADVTKKLESKQQRVDTLTEIVGEKERNETTRKLQVEELKKGIEEDRARAEKDKRSLAADVTKKVQQHVDNLTKAVREKELDKTTLRQQLEELKKGKEEDRARAELEKRSLAADMTKKFESKQQQVDTLTEIVGEKGRNETTLRQQVEELKKGREEDRARLEKNKLSIELSWKKEHDYKERLEQLERETWKLRTKIQLESEIRSAEQKKKAETRQLSFISRFTTAEKQAQGDTSSFEDNSTGGLGMSDTLQAGEEPPDDEFAGIIQQIADDLYDEAKIDSLAGQLGIIHGDIQRALMTNVKFNRVTSDGTRHMLRQWRRGVSREDERIELKKALQAAKLVNLADLYLSEGHEHGDMVKERRRGWPDEASVDVRRRKRKKSKSS